MPLHASLQLFLAFWPHHLPKRHCLICLGQGCIAPASLHRRWTDSYCHPGTHARGQGLNESAVNLHYPSLRESSLVFAQKNISSRIGRQTIIYGNSAFFTAVSSIYLGRSILVFLMIRLLLWGGWFHKFCELCRGLTRSVWGGLATHKTKHDHFSEVELFWVTKFDTSFDEPWLNICAMGKPFKREKAEFNLEKPTCAEMDLQNGT